MTDQKVFYTAPMSAEELAEQIAAAVAFDHDGGGDGYSQSADAMWKAAALAFNFAASQVGATGFQASWAALRFYAEVMHVECPFMLIKAEDALYPQYDLLGSVATWLGEQEQWLSEQAAAKLAQPHDHAVRPVVEHWQRLAAQVSA